MSSNTRGNKNQAQINQLVYTSQYRRYWILYARILKRERYNIICVTYQFLFLLKRFCISFGSFVNFS
ncbi:unnamed protein product [Schistosoma turkestanicum]|nr:unnamed protein product [Schistosoma turkestanicum]